MMCVQQGFRSACISAQTEQSSLYAVWIAKDPKLLDADSDDSDQTAGMRRLI